MAKYHINAKGEAGKCSATKGNCPFGDSSEHYDSAEEARIAYEEKQDEMQVTLVPNTVVGVVDAKGFAASTYPSHPGFEPKPVRAVVSDAKTGKTGFVAVTSRQGHLTHVMRDNPRWRQGMGIGKLIMFGNTVCKEGSSGASSSKRITGGHNDPTPPSEALEASSDVCTGCATKMKDPTYN